MRVEYRANLDNLANTTSDMKIESILVTKTNDGTDEVTIVGELRKTGERFVIEYPRAITTLRFESIYVTKDHKAEFFSITMLDNYKKPTLWQHIKNVLKRIF